MKQRSKLRSFQPNIAMVLMVVIVGLGGSYLLTSSFADVSDHTPAGGLDYCDVESGATVLYGWGYDPDAGAGAQPYVKISVGTSTVTLPTDRSGYRVASVNNYIDQHYAGGPKPDYYGWRAQFSGLYQGNSYSVSGQVLNYGAPNNAATPKTMTVRASAGTSDVASKPYFAGNKLPTSCLVVKPAPAPTPAPAPAPVAPAPTPAPAPVAPAKTTKTTKTTTSGPANATPAPASNAATASAPTVFDTADGDVTVGTLGASIKVSAGNASQIHLIYGTDAQNLTTATDDVTVSGSDATIDLDNLNANTQYSYQIVRTGADGTVTTSATASFKTSGYTIMVRFVTGKNSPISGIKGMLTDAKNASGTSGKDGSLTFKNLASGSYVVTYQYKGVNHTQDFDTDDATVSNSDTSSDSDTTPQTAVLSATINVDKLISSGRSSKKSPLPAVLAIICLLLLIGFFIWFIRRRRNRQTDGTVAPHAPTPAAPDIIDQQMHNHFEANKPPTPQPTHMGESLREMVIKSMHEEAQKKKQQGPPDSQPPV